MGYEPYGGFRFLGLFLLFPVGWILLGHSVATWKIGLASYVAAGLLFTVMAAALGWFGAPGYGQGQTPPELFVLVPLLWPVYTLGALDLFGLHFFD